MHSRWASGRLDETVEDGNTAIQDSTYKDKEEGAQYYSLSLISDSMILSLSSTVP